VLTLNDHQNQKKKVNNVDEVSPGIFEVTEWEAELLVANGHQRSVDYAAIGIIPTVLGPNSMLKEISTHAEFSQRSLGICIIDNKSTYGKLQRIFWYQGKQFFPKEDLELAVNGKEIAIVFANQGIKDLEAASNIIKYLLPPDTVSFDLLDVLWTEGDQVGSMMCDGDCCPLEGFKLSELPEEI
jgi:hypothetical protein